MGIRACSLAVLLFTGLAAAQEDAGTKAFRLGNYAEAERNYRAALAEHETPDAVRRLADLYSTQGKNTDAEPLLIRLVALCEETSGAESVELWGQASCCSRSRRC